MNIKVIAIKAGVPTANGNVYPREVIEKMLAKANDKTQTMFLYPDLQAAFREDLSEAIGVVKKMDIDSEGFMNLDCKILSGKEQSAVVQMLQKGFVEVTPQGKGLIEENSITDTIAVVKEFQLTSFSIVPKQQPKSKKPEQLPPESPVQFKEVYNRLFGEFHRLLIVRKNLDDTIIAIGKELESLRSTIERIENVQ